VRELSANTGLEPQDIPRILSTAVRPLNAQKRMNFVVASIAATAAEQQQGLANLGLSDSEQAVLGGLLDLQLNPASIDANIFPMLSLAPDLKTATRESGLFGVHALALQKLSAKNLGLSEKKAQAVRVETTHKVIAEKLSVSQTRRLVSEIITLDAKTEPIPQKKVKQVSAAARSLQQLSSEIFAQADPSQLIEFQEVLQQKLAEIEEILK